MFCVWGTGGLRPPGSNLQNPTTQSFQAAAPGIGVLIPGIPCEDRSHTSAPTIARDHFHSLKNQFELEDVRKIEALQLKGVTSDHGMWGLERQMQCTSDYASKHQSDDIRTGTAC